MPLELLERLHLRLVHGERLGRLELAARGEGLHLRHPLRLEVREHLAGRALEDGAPALQEEHRVEEREGREARLVDDADRVDALRRERLERDDQRARGGRVEARGRLVLRGVRKSRGR